MFEKYEKLTGGQLSAYISELTLIGYSDNEIAMQLIVRWAYLFPMPKKVWDCIIAEFREIQYKQERSV